MSQPKRTLAILEAAERSKKTRVKVSAFFNGEQFVYRDGELHEYTHPILKRTAAR